MRSKLAVGIFDGKGPIDAAMGGVASLLPSVDLHGEGCLIRQTTVQALATEDADFDFRHVEPACVLGRVVKDDAAQQLIGGLQAKNLDETVAKVGVQIAQHQVNTLGSGIDDLDEMVRISRNVAADFASS